MHNIPVSVWVPCKNCNGRGFVEGWNPYWFQTTAGGQVCLVCCPECHGSRGTMSAMILFPAMPCVTFEVTPQPTQEA